MWIKYVGTKEDGEGAFSKESGYHWFIGDVFEVRDANLARRMLQHPDVFKLAEEHERPAPFPSPVAAPIAPPPVPVAVATPVAPAGLQAAVPVQTLAGAGELAGGGMDPRGAPRAPTGEQLEESAKPPAPQPTATPEAAAAAAAAAAGGPQPITAGELDGLSDKQVRALAKDRNLTVPANASGDSLKMKLLDAQAASLGIPPV